MKSFNSLLSIVALVTLNACHPSGQTTAIQSAYAEGKQITLTAISDRIIHVRHQVSGQQQKPSLIVKNEPGIVVNAVQENSLRTNMLEVQLNETGDLVSFLDAKGKEILSEAGRTIEALDAGVFNLFQTEQRWKADETEAYYGLGQYYESQMNYQGEKLKIEQFNRDAVFPLVVSSGGYAILWDVNSRSHFDATADGEIAFGADSTFNFDYYFIYGPEYDTIISEYRKLTGQAPMFPKWAYGYMQVRETYKTQDEVLQIASKFRELEFPIDMIVQDWRYWGKDENHDYQYKWGGMIWEPTKFPNPREMIRTLHDDLNMKYMVVIWPVIGDSTELKQELEQAGGMLNGRHGGSQSRLYDAYNPKMRDIYWEYAKQGIYDLGADAWWMDGSEPVVPKSGFYSGNTAYGPMGSCTNAFSLVHCEGIYDHQRADNPSKRVFIITRSGYPGQQRAGAATWSGDIFADWYSYEKSIASGVNYSMSGLPYWTMDIGGWYSKAYLPQGENHPGFRELYTRWFQYASFCPLFRSHGSKFYREPWLFGEETMAILKDYTDLRYRLMPYTYTLASEVTREQATIMRGMPLAFPDDENCRENGNQFMYGPSILVSPVFESRNGKNQPIASDLLSDKSGQLGGLTATYFSGQNFDKKIITKRDPQVGFFWPSDSLANWLQSLNLELDNFSARWEGYFQTDLEGEYFFNLFDVKSNFSQPQARLWVNGVKVLDYWDQKSSRRSGTIKLPTDTRVAIRLEFKSTDDKSNIYLKCTAPMNDGQVAAMRQKVYLPKGTDWFDFWTGEKLTGGQLLSLPIDINKMPLHVKAGSIVPMGPYLQYTSEKKSDTLELRIYPGKDAFYTLYEDEGDNYNYEKGAYVLIPMHWDDKAQKLTIGKQEGEFPGMLTSRKFKIIMVSDGHGNGLTPISSQHNLINYEGLEVVIGM